MKKWLLLCLCVVSATAVSKELTLDWVDLIPIAERGKMLEQPAPLLHEGDTPKQSLFGGVRTELANSKVRIPGFVIPLEGDDTTVTEFLLAPFMGACIHVPPPPPNQIVYVKAPKGVPLQELWDVVWVYGTLKVEPISHELAQAGYQLIADKVTHYDGD